MRRFVVLGISLLIIFSALVAQKPFTLLDTVLIEEVTSYGELRKYQSGAKIERLSTQYVNLVQEGGLDQLLKRFTPVYIKTDAGGLATIRFRGTSPNHTSINFGGININSLTLGHSNLANISSFLFDEIDLQYGSSSTVNGSGAIGGALYLGLENNWTNGLRINAKASIGSFGEYLGGTKVFLGNSRFEWITRAFFYKKENDFPFNNVYTGILNSKGVPDIQKGASLENIGLLQEINYKINLGKYIKSAFWLDYNWRQVQPNMQTNYFFSNTQEIKNRNFRFWSEFIDNEHIIKYKGGLGYVHDNQIFDGLEEQVIQTDRLIAELQASTNFDCGIGLKTGTKYKYIVPNVHAYSDFVVDFEQHLDLYFSSFYRTSPNLKFTLNLRQTFVTNFDAPFTPSFGAEYIFRTGSHSFFKFSSTLARSYRVPTLNDRYWGIQGNPDLKPEKGNNFEFGVNYNSDLEGCKTTVGVNAFYMDVKNWIEWRNFGVWMAQNVQEVVSKGFEIQSATYFSLGRIDTDLTLNYTINPVKSVKTRDNNDLSDRQLIYVPKHMGNGSLGLNYKKWYLLVDGQYTGSRYTDDFGTELPSHIIANCSLKRELIMRNNRIDLTISSNNLLNTEYQNERYYAMPGRHYRFSVTYNFQNIKN